MYARNSTLQQAILSDWIEQQLQMSNDVAGRRRNRKSMRGLRSNWTKTNCDE